MAEQNKQPENDAPQAPAAPEAPQAPEGAPQPPAGAPQPPQVPEDEHQRTQDVIDQLTTPDPYPNDPDSPSFSSPIAMVGWFMLGFFFALLGLLVTFLLCRKRSPEVRSRAITYCCLGVLTEVILGTIAVGLLGVDANQLYSFSAASSSSASVW